MTGNELIPNLEIGEIGFLKDQIGKLPAMNFGEFKILFEALLVKKADLAPEELAELSYMMTHMAIHKVTPSVPLFGIVANGTAGAAISTLNEDPEKTIRRLINELFDSLGLLDEDIPNDEISFKNNYKRLSSLGNQIKNIHKLCPNGIRPIAIIDDNNILANKRKIIKDKLWTTKRKLSQGLKLSTVESNLENEITKKKIAYKIKYCDKYINKYQNTLLELCHESKKISGDSSVTMKTYIKQHISSGVISGHVQGNYGKSFYGKGGDGSTRRNDIQSMLSNSVKEVQRIFDEDFKGYINSTGEERN